MSADGTALKAKMDNALHEARILIIGTQVLLGFHFNAFLQARFEHFSRALQTLSVAGLGLLLLAFGLLVAPVAYHRIVEAGDVSRALHRFTTLAVGAALLPMAVTLAIGGYVIADRIDLFIPPAVVALTVLSVALGCWYVLPLALRGHRGGGESMTDRSEVGLPDKIKQALTEIRVVLPGAQALLGFSFGAILAEPFEHLPRTSQLTHFVGVGFVLLATILLMTPASRHRITEHGEDTEDFLRFTSHMLLLAMAALALGMSAQVLVVVRRVYDSVPLAATAAGLTAVSFFAVWFGLTTWLRARRRAVRPAHTRAGRREAA